MQPLIRIAGKIILILFLLWHAFSVAFYSIPRDAKDVFSVWTRIDVLPVITPYMYVTSQWQLWNIFAPDPLRRVTAYRIDVQREGTWQHLITIEPNAYGILRHATRMKLMNNMLDEFSDNRAAMAGRYLALLCAEKGVPSDTPIRLTYEYYVLPLLTEAMNTQWWHNWQAKRMSNVGFTTTCP